MISNPCLRVAATRGSTIESFHEVDAIVMDARGTRMESFGEINAMVFPRSSIKMLQALLLVESGAYEKFGLEKKHLALACASHWAEDIHLEIVNDWLNKLGLQESDLECGAHWPGQEKDMHELIKAGLKPKKIHNNCSGKHCGFMTVAKHLNESVFGYSGWDHPVQAKLRKILSDLSRNDYSHARWGVDGCGVPTYAAPLKDTAFALAHFLGEMPLPKPRWIAMQEIIEAIQENPLLISGRGSVDSRIIELSKGEVIIKTGAEGVYAVIMPRKGLVMLLKARDGVTRASRGALAFLLKRYKAFTDDKLVTMEEILLPPIRNWAGEVVGGIQAFEVEE